MTNHLTMCDVNGTTSVMKKSGRPKTPSPKDLKLSIRIDEETSDALGRYAASLGEDVSTAARIAMRAGLRDAGCISNLKEGSSR